MRSRARRSCRGARTGNGGWRRCAPSSPSAVCGPTATSSTPATEPYGGSYSLLVDAQGRTRRLSAQSDSLEGERHLSLTRTPGGPWVVESTSGSNPLYALDDAADISLGRVDVLPLAAAAAAGRPRATTPSSASSSPSPSPASRFPTLAVRAVAHHYTFRGDGVVSYRGPDGDGDADRRPAVLRRRLPRGSRTASRDLAGTLRGRRSRLARQRCVRTADQHGRPSCGRPGSTRTGRPAPGVRVERDRAWWTSPDSPTRPRTSSPSTPSR